MCTLFLLTGVIVAIWVWILWAKNGGLYVGWKQNLSIVVVQAIINLIMLCICEVDGLVWHLFLIYLALSLKNRSFVWATIKLSYIICFWPYCLCGRF